MYNFWHWSYIDGDTAWQLYNCDFCVFKYLYSVHVCSIVDYDSFYTHMRCIPRQALRKANKMNERMKNGSSSFSEMAPSQSSVGARDSQGVSSGHHSPPICWSTNIHHYYSLWSQMRAIVGGCDLWVWIIGHVSVFWGMSSEGRVKESYCDMKVLYVSVWPSIVRLVGAFY